MKIKWRLRGQETNMKIKWRLRGQETNMKIKWRLGGQETNMSEGLGASQKDPRVQSTAGYLLPGLISADCFTLPTICDDK